MSKSEKKVQERGWIYNKIFMIYDLWFNKIFVKEKEKKKKKKQVHKLLKEKHAQ